MVGRPRPRPQPTFMSTSSPNSSSTSFTSLRSPTRERTRARKARGSDENARCAIDSARLVHLPAARHEGVHGVRLIVELLNVLLLRLQDAHELLERHCERTSERGRRARLVNEYSGARCRTRTASGCPARPAHALVDASPSSCVSMRKMSPSEHFQPMAARSASRTAQPLEVRHGSASGRGSDGDAPVSAPFRSQLLIRPQRSVSYFENAARHAASSSGRSLLIGGVYARRNDATIGHRYR